MEKNKNKKKIKIERNDSMLKGKKVIAIGDRDGIPGPAIEACVKSAGAEVIFASTECFV
jgi:glycine reductase